MNPYEQPERTETPARAPETATQYLAREQAEILLARDAESERLRTYLKDCRCPCCDARARLRSISYERACESSASIHCAETDRRDDNSDAAALSLYALANSDEERQAVRAAAEVSREPEDTGPRPAGTD